MNPNKHLIGLGTILSGIALSVGLVKGEENLRVSNMLSVDAYIVEHSKPRTKLLSKETNSKTPYVQNESGSAPDEDGDLVSIINDLDTSDPQTLAFELIWYSGDRFAQDWADNGQELKDSYLSYIDLLLETPLREQWAGFEEEIALLYHTLADFSDDNIEKTRMYIKAIKFLENYYYPRSIRDNYELGKAFVNMSLTHPGELSKEGSKVQAIEYFSKARDGNLILALQDYYNELAHTHDNLEEIRTNLGDEMRALLYYNDLLCRYEGEDLQKRLFEPVDNMKIHEIYKHELLFNPPSPQEHLQIEDVYLTD